MEQVHGVFPRRMWYLFTSNGEELVVNYSLVKVCTVESFANAQPFQAHSASKTDVASSWFGAGFKCSLNLLDGDPIFPFLTRQIMRQAAFSEYATAHPPPEHTRPYAHAHAYNARPYKREVANGLGDEGADLVLIKN